jgi:hypothetical protein
MSSINVFLDDYRTAPTGYVLVETIDECLDLLQRFCVGHLSLDHDLVSRTRNGLKLVEIMVKERLFANQITIHSANAVGGKAMYQHLVKAQKKSIVPPETIITLRPLPLYSYPPPLMEHYLENR